MRQVGLPIPAPRRAAGPPRCPGTGSVAWAFFSLLLGPVALVAQETGSIAGTVREAAGEAPVSGALVRIDGTTLVSSSDAEGVFRFEAVPAGPQVVVVTHPSHVTATQEVDVTGGEERTVTVHLSPVPEPEEFSRLSSSRVIERADIELAAIQGLDLIDLLTRTVPSIRTREGGLVGGFRCIEYRGGAPGAACRQLGLVIDGVRSQNPALQFETVLLGDISRIQVLSPSEAGTRYGGVGGWGMVIVETRRGPQTSRVADEGRLISGFDWSEEAEPYPWARVLVGTTLANGAAVALSYEANNCLRLSRKVRYVALRTECGSWGTVGSVFLMTALPSLSASLAARFAGQTERSRGRFVPSMVIGSAITVGGWVALLYGDAEDNQVASIAGITILTVGTPVFTTLADRVLRQLR
jgi:hypothetical protein